jgi:PLP dependent protein
VTNSSKQNRNDLQQRLHAVQRRIRQAESSCQRDANSVQLLAVSKTRGADEIRSLAEQEHRLFGESYLQEALTKIAQLKDLNLEWHFIGRIQSNKTRQIAEHFDWVHSVASLKHATRLSEQRPAHLAPLNICLQVNTSGELSKDGHTPEELSQLLPAYLNLANLQICGLMTIPAPAENSADPHHSFRQLRQLRDQLCSEKAALKTLSMGMSNDLEAAICEGASIVRIGTAIFGPRQYNQ